MRRAHLLFSLVLPTPCIAAVEEKPAEAEELAARWHEAVGEVPAAFAPQP